MDANDVAKFNALSPTKRTAFKILKSAARDLLNGECSDEEIADTMSKLSPTSNGFKREEDYVTVDEGMRMLGMGQNRVAFCNLMRKNGIVNEKFKNVSIGYRRDKILSLLHKSEDQYQQRLAKNRRKKKKERQFYDFENGNNTK